MFVVATFVGIAGTALIMTALIALVFRQKSNLIFGKYPCKGFFYDLKYMLALLMIKHLKRKLYNNKEEEFYTDIFLQKLDKPQTLTDDPNSYDVISFMAANENGNKLMLSLERRKRGVIKACIYLYLPELGVFCSPKLPDMLYFITNGTTDSNAFKGSGFHLKPEEYMRSWRVRYEGQLRHIATDELRFVKLNLVFSSNVDYFNYNKDLSTAVIADSLAREAWNDDFYHLMNNADKMLVKRTHYEQNGTLTGEMHISGIDDIDQQIQMQAVRDHSFGTERCLSTINRYVYFTLFLNDGTNIVVGNLSQPTFFLSSLKVGYVCTSMGIYEPITSSNFELYTYGEKGKPPQHQNFIIQTAADTYFIQIKAEDVAVRYIGPEWESKVFLQFVSCTVNDVAGHGLTEYMYRNSGGRPADVRCHDPEWYQDLHKSASHDTCHNSEIC